MVVYQLYRYVWNNVGGVRDTVSIVELANEHRKKHPNPMLVVDGRSVVTMVVRAKLRSSLHDFNFSNYIKVIKEYVESFRKHGIAMVFFFGEADNKEANSSIAKEIPSRKIYPQAIESLFEQVEEGFSEKCKLLAPGMIALSLYILKYECRCTVYSSANKSREMAKFATDTPECFGILATDNDHIIFTEKPSFSSKYLKIEEMETNMVVRSKVLKALEMDSCQLRLLACLAGNYLNDDLNDFHKRISPKYGSRDTNFIVKIKKYMDNKRWFGDEEKLNEVSSDTGVNLERLRKCMSYYEISQNYEDGPVNEDPTLSALREKCTHCLVPSKVKEILVSQKFRQVILMEDRNEDSIPSVSLIYKPIRQRMYYLLFNENVSVKEWLGYRNSNAGQEDNVVSLKVNIGEDIPSLKTRIEESAECEVRWKLLKACFESSIPTEQLQSVEKRFVLLCCLLNYLLNFEGVNLEEFEVKAFICQALLLHNQPLATGKEEATYRSIRVAATLWEGIRCLICVVPVCGFPISLEDTMPWTFFDGKVFYWCYNRLKDASDPDRALRELLKNNDEDLAKFCGIYNTVVRGTNLVK